MTCTEANEKPRKGFAKGHKVIKTSLQNDSCGYSTGNRYGRVRLRAMKCLRREKKKLRILKGAKKRVRREKLGVETMGLDDPLVINCSREGE